MRNAGLEETKAGIKIARRNINKLRYADDSTLMAESEEELKSGRHCEVHSRKNMGFQNRLGNHFTIYTDITS